MFLIRPGRQRFLFALLLSLTLHSLFALFVYFLPLKGTWNTSGLFEIGPNQTKSEERDLEIELVFSEPIPQASGPNEIGPRVKAQAPDPKPVAAPPLVRPSANRASVEAPATNLIRSGINQPGNVPDPGQHIVKASWIGPGPVEPARGGPLGFQGGGVTTFFFQVPTQARKVIYVVDRSSSMGLRGAWDVARQELAASLARLTNDTQFLVILYNRQPLLLASRAELVPATPDNKLQVIDELKRTGTEGGTDHLQALRRALSLQPEVIYFLTDGDDMTPQQVRAVTQCNNGRASIHVIELGPDSSTQRDSALRPLAETNRGIYHPVSINQ